MERLVFVWKIPSEELLRRAEQALSGCLEEIPFVQMGSSQRCSSPSSPFRAWDFCAELKLGKKGQKLAVAVLANGEPRNIRLAVERLQREAQATGIYGIVIAPYISAQSAEICKEANVGYIDFAGNCLLSFQKIYIHKSGRKNPLSEQRVLRSLFYPKAERILRVLLNDPYRAWKVQTLAQEAQVSLGQVSNVKRLLEDREWLRAGTEGAGFSVENPEALLAEWAEHYNYRRNGNYDFYSLKSVHDIEYDLAEICGQENIPFALTRFSGAARYAFYARYQRVTAYVEGPIEEIANRLKLKPVTTGANTSLLAPYDTGVFYGALNLDNVPVVSPIQTYLDVKAAQGRGEEAAEFLLDEVIKRKWQRADAITAEKK